MTWTFFSDYPGVTVVVGLVFLLAVMYLVRDSAHQALLRLGRLAHRLLRSLARLAQNAAAALARSNRDALSALQRELVQRQLDREFQRLGAVVERDTAGFQQLQRAMHEHLDAITKDFEHSTQVPPASPEWVAAVEAVARLPADTGAESVGRILGDIHNTIQEQQRDAMREYRWTTSARHKILLGMRPHWHKLSQRAEDMGHKVQGLNRRMAHIDQLMARFEALTAGGRVRFGPVAGRFALATMAVLLGLAGVMLNVVLLQRPLEVILAGESLGPLSLGGFIALVHSLAIIALGVVICESLQLTRMLPLVCGLSARSRAALCLGAGGLLAGLAVLESLLLGWWASSGPLAGVLSLQVLALLGLLLPPLLALSALSLESFLMSLRPLVGWLLQGLLLAVAVAARLGGGLALELGRLAVQVYDLLLFLPLAAERAVLQRRARGQTSAADTQPGVTVTALEFDRSRKAQGD